MRRLVTAVLVLLMVAPAAAAADVERLYFLAGPGGTEYYSSDPDDPEAPRGTLSGGCSFVIAATPDRLCQLTFAPAVALDAPLRWSAAAPLRFHLELEGSTLTESRVSIFVQSMGQQYESPPATQVRPGVWEGELTGGPGTVDPAAMTMLGIRLRAADATRLTARLRGRSWIELPEPITGRSVPELLAADPAPTAPGSYVTPERRFTFSDGDWSAQSFDGNLAQDAMYSVTLPAAATAVYAWAEHDRGPVVHAAASGRAPDSRMVTDIPVVAIKHNGQFLGKGGAFSQAAASVPAGTVQVWVTRSALTRSAQSKPYRLHVVAVHGERTLRTLRWRTVILGSFTAPGISNCPHTFDPLVVPAAATTFSVGLTWSSPNPVPRWGLTYDLPTVGSFVCGETASDQQVRFVLPRVTRVHLFEPRIVTGGVSVSVSDTVFEFEARLTY